MPSSPTEDFKGTSEKCDVKDDEMRDAK